MGLVVDDINMIITQSTIAYNEGSFSFGLIDNSNVIMTNSILWNEQSDYEFTPLPNNSIINVESYYSDVRILDNINHINSINSNPLFHNPNDFHFTLNQDSPCIDTGTDSLILNNQAIIDMENSEYSGNMPDMGYFEYYSNISYGDVNLDLIINIIDILFMIDIILDQNISDAFSLDAADMNQDDIINIFDIIELLNLILNN